MLTQSGKLMCHQLIPFDIILVAITLTIIKIPSKFVRLCASPRDCSKLNSCRRRAILCNISFYRSAQRYWWWYYTIDSAVYCKLQLPLVVKLVSIINCPRLGCNFTFKYYVMYARFPALNCVSLAILLGFV